MRIIFYRIIAAIALVILLPLFVVLYLLVKLTSKGPYIFKQKRVGERGKIFTMYKIRAMIQNAEKLKQKYKHLNEADGPVFKIRNDPRYTKVGKFLSYTALDELPQLLNVVKGDMSLVGPRPLPVDETARASSKYQARFSIPPGITSPWVIQGSHRLSFSKWMQLDLDYVVNNSLFYDLKILLMTSKVILESLFRNT